MAADCESRHQSTTERGASLVGEDRGKGGWNHLDAAKEEELLCLSGRGECGWKEGLKKWQKRYKQEKEKSTWASRIMNAVKQDARERKRVDKLKRQLKTVCGGDPSDSSFLLTYICFHLSGSFCTDIFLSFCFSPLRSAGPRGHVWQAKYNNQAPVRWKVKPLWCFKHDAVVGQTCTGLHRLDKRGGCQLSGRGLTVGNPSLWINKSFYIQK